ncbi:glutamate receptor ionotropic, kainate 2-like isoform X4 [Argopecten irradians]|uniref:glutamate receptor ionotropic, kainate 2-like isoform X4 n=1 Tax=Argopecten irradians TaxID=31199 RepID=UPI003718FE17
MQRFVKLNGAIGMRFTGILTLVLLADSIYGTEQQDTKKVGILHPSQTSVFDLIDDLLIRMATNITVTYINATTYGENLDHYQNADELVKTQKISALVGHFSETFAIATEHNRIPYFVTDMVPWNWRQHRFLIRIIPDINIYRMAICDILKYFNWMRVGVLYDNDAASQVVINLIGNFTDRIKAFNIRYNSTSANVRNALKELRDNYFEKFIILCSSKNADIVLTQALYLSLLSRPNTWLVVNMGVDDIALDKYIDSRANMTSLSLMLDTNTSFCALTGSNWTLSNAVYHDSLKIYQAMLDFNNGSGRFQMLKTLRQITIDGCTGHVEFTKAGKRKETFLRMSTLATLKNGTTNESDYQNTLFQSGTWRSLKDTMQQRIEPSKSYDSVMRMGDDIFGSEPLRITTIIEPPFIQWKNDTPLSHPIYNLNEHLEGFCVSVLEEMAKLLDFTYNLTLVPDGKFGSLKTHGWTGMVRVLFEKEADIALAPFQITPKRSMAVDFTKPFMTKGTSVVVKKPDRGLSPFQFLSPLSKFVWIAIFLCFVTTALVLFATSRVNNDKKSKFMHNLRESFWYIWGTILRGNLTGSPTGISSRIVSASWWFFSLIIISIYTANLAAFLTISNAHIPIDSAADLADQTDYDYGTVDGSQIENFFKHTNISHYAKMWAHMHLLSKESMVRRVENGFDRVLREKYAFLWDSPVVRHHIANDCGLTEIGSPFDLKGYGIATQKDSIYTERLSWATLKLNDDGILYRLEGKWWRRPNCPDPRQSANSKAIEINVASGMFIVLLGGIVLSIVVFLGEMLYYKARAKNKKPIEEREENNIHSSGNHVGNNAAETSSKDDEVRTVLSRTLSIGEKCVHNRWE